MTMSVERLRQAIHDTQPESMVPVPAADLHAMLNELLALREQVTQLQSFSTQQLLAVRKGVWNTVEKAYYENVSIVTAPKRSEHFNHAGFRARLRTLLEQS